MAAEKGEIDYQKAEEIPSVLAVAGLVHYIGNPPFGHFGEETIRTWFKEWFDSDERDGYKKVSELYGQQLKDDEKKDFLYFEGNAQAIRILTRLQFQNDHSGINFTYGTLAALIKYPHTSEYVDPTSSTKMMKKFGVFQSEAVFQEICKATGIRNGIRSPLTFLLEASDDIAYLAADLEDGVKKGVVPWQDVYEALRNDFASRSKEYTYMFKYVDDVSERAKTNKVPERNH